MYDLAALLAARATTDLYVQLRNLIASNNGQDAATALSQQGGPAPSVQQLANVFSGTG